VSFGVLRKQSDRDHRPVCECPNQGDYPSLTAKLILLTGLAIGLLFAKLIFCMAVWPLKRVPWLANALHGPVAIWNLFLFTVFGMANAIQ
jgi:hypothetical protein